MLFWAIGGQFKSGETTVDIFLMFLLTETAFIVIAH